MPKARTYDVNGKEVGTEELPAGLYDGVVNEDVLHQVVKAYMANQRQGTGSAKNRAAARGGSRKPWRQKGTGRARQGTIRAPQWAGGGRAFPPIPKSWRQDLPKKVKALARRSAHNARAEDERVLLVGSLEFEAPKTRQLKELLASIGAEGKILLLTDGLKKNVYLSGRNVQEIQVLPFGEESAYDLLWATVVVIERSALEGVPAEAPTKKWPREEKPKAEKKAAPKAEKPKAEKKEKPKAEKKKAEKKKEAPAAEEVEIPEPPTVKELSDFLAEIDDPDVIRAMQAGDDRKTAQAHYARRLGELEGEESGDA